MKYKATLVRGRTYHWNNRQFEGGKPVLVTEKEYEYLSANAVDDVTVEGVSEERKKFKFVPVSDEEPVTEPRQRRRKPDTGEGAEA